MPLLTLLFALVAPRVASFQDAKDAQRKAQTQADRLEGQLKEARTELERLRAETETKTAELNVRWYFSLRCRVALAWCDFARWRKRTRSL